jgi:hypothetical protein
MLGRLSAVIPFAMEHEAKRKSIKITASSVQIDVLSLWHRSAISESFVYVWSIDLCLLLNRKLSFNPDSDENTLKSQ